MSASGKGPHAGNQLSFYVYIYIYIYIYNNDNTNNNDNTSEISRDESPPRVPSLFVQWTEVGACIHVCIYIYIYIYIHVYIYIYIYPVDAHPV